MASFTSNFPELIEQRQKWIFFTQLERLELKYPHFFNIVTSVKAYEDAMRMAGLGTFVLKPEGNPISYDDPIQGSRVRVTHITYALGFRVTMEMWMDDLHGVMDRMPNDLADSAKDHQENLAWSVIINGFVTTFYTGLDAGALFATHTLLRTGAGTYSNQLSPAIALSQTGLQALLIQARKLVNETGRRVVLRPKTLLIPPDLEFTAAELLESLYKVDSADNNINPVAMTRIGVKPAVVEYLSSATNWFLLADKGGVGPGEDGGGNGHT